MRKQQRVSATVMIKSRLEGRGRAERTTELKRVRDRERERENKRKREAGERMRETRR